MMNQHEFYKLPQETNLGPHIITNPLTIKQNPVIALPESAWTKSYSGLKPKRQKGLGPDE
jgi:hypothetical protein